MRCFLIIFFFLFIAAPSYGSNVLRANPTLGTILVSQDDRHGFVKGDYVCVLSAGIQIACGSVILVSQYAAIVRLNFKEGDIADGGLVERVPETLKKDFDPLENPSVSFEESVAFYRELFYRESRVQIESFDPPPPSRRYNILGGAMSAGPTFEVQFSTKEKHAIGLELVRAKFGSSFPFLSNGITADLWGGIVNYNYYTYSSFSGFWIRGGIGYFGGPFQNKGSMGNIETLSSIFTIGYRLLSGPLNLGVAVGLQTFHASGSQNLPFDTSILTPTAALNLGWTIK